MKHIFTFTFLRTSTAKFCLTVFSFVVGAQAQWVQTAGPLGPDLRALFVAGPNLFAGTSAGAFVSSNNGATWTEINSGITPFATVLCYAASGPNLLAGTTA